MAAPSQAVDIAFTYAWWLTGDSAAAEAAVLRAAERIAGVAPLNGGGPDPALALLEAVRADAIRERTMCPASELALLHDGQGIELPDAARLARIDPEDARVELAHGRLEALLETVREPFAHPERLGGLAVGNPPDIAHARQCASCGEVTRLLQRGREALREIPPPPTPPDLADLLALLDPRHATGQPPVEPEPEPQSAAVAGDEPELATEEPPAVDEPVVAAEPPATAEAPRVLQFDDLDPYEPPAAAEPAEAEPPAGRPSRLLAVVVLLALALLAVTAVATLWPGGTEPAVDRTPSEQPSAGVGPDPATSPTNASPVAATTPASPPATFRVLSVGMLRRGEFVPAGPGIVLTRTDRVRVAVRYEGAVDGVLLRAHWRVDGEPFHDLEVGLGAATSQHVFTAPVPQDGWPPGLHQVVLTVGEDVVGNVDFRVV